MRCSCKTHASILSFLTCVLSRHTVFMLGHTQQTNCHRFTAQQNTDKFQKTSLQKVETFILKKILKLNIGMVVQWWLETHVGNVLFFFPFSNQCQTVKNYHQSYFKKVFIPFNCLLFNLISKTICFIFYSQLSSSKSLASIPFVLFADSRSSGPINTHG